MLGLLLTGKIGVSLFIKWYLGFRLGGCGKEGTGLAACHVDREGGFGSIGAGVESARCMSCNMLA